MKTILGILILAVLMVCVPLISTAQTPYTLLNNHTYTSTTKDTLIFPQAALSANLVTMDFVMKDSCKADLTFEQKKEYDTTWTSIYTDSLINTTAAGIGNGYLHKEIVLRSATVERLATLVGTYRCRVVHRTASAGVTTPKENATLRYR